MATKIKLMRLGKVRAPYYRVVVADARTRRDGRVIETIGKYHPKEDPSYMEVDAERVAYWLGVGAQPTEPVTAILKVTGDWQKFKGEPAPPPMKVAAPKPDKKEIFQTAARESAGVEEKPATTPKKPKKAAAADATDAAPAVEADAKSDSAKSDSAKSDSAKAETAKADKPKADTAKAATAKADAPKADAPKADAPKADAPKADAAPAAAAE